MTQGPEQDDTAPTAPLELGTVSQLLELCQTPEATPAQRLIDRLAQPGGPEWASLALSEFHAPSGHDGLAILTNGAGGLEAAEALKDAGKRGVQEHDGGEPESRAVLDYLAAVAAALAHHNRMISSRGPGALAELFMDLADAFDDPIRPVFTKAIQTLDLLAADPTRFERHERRADN